MKCPPRLSFSFLIGTISAAATLVFGVTALSAPYAQPDAEITVTVDDRLAEPGTVADGELPFTVSQEAVDAAFELHEIGGYQPLSVSVSADPAPEALDSHIAVESGAFSPDADLTLYLGDPVLGNPVAKPARQIVALADEVADELPRYGDDLRYNVAEIVQRSIANGHGPGAVAAAAQNAAHLVRPAPDPVMWAAGTGISLATTFFAFYLWYRRRSRREDDQRRLAAARSELARTVLDLEALETSYRTAETSQPEREDDAAGGPIGTEQSWQQIQQTVRALQETEPELVQRLERSKSVPRQQKNADRLRLENFIEQASDLTAHAHALEATLAIDQGWSTAERALQELLAPIFGGVVELTTRVDAALAASPPRAGLSEDERTQFSHHIDRLRSGHRSMLRLITERMTAREHDDDRVWQYAWADAEAELAAAAEALYTMIGPAPSPQPGTQRGRICGAGRGLHPRGAYRPVPGSHHGSVRESCQSRGTSPFR